MPEPPFLDRKLRTQWTSLRHCGIVAGGRSRTGRRTVLTLFFRWTKTDEESIADYKLGKLSYTYGGKPSRKAFWVFELASAYRPGRRIIRDRILLAFDFGPRGDTGSKTRKTGYIFRPPPSSAKPSTRPG
jgi:hypothetical protein